MNILLKQGWKRQKKKLLLTVIMLLTLVFTPALSWPKASDKPSSGSIVVVLTASWCGTCRELIPVFKNVVNDYASSGLKLVVLDVDDYSNHSLASSYGINLDGSDLPQVYLSRHGNTVLLFNGDNYQFGQTKQAESQIRKRLLGSI